MAVVGENLARNNRKEFGKLNGRRIPSGIEEIWEICTEYVRSVRHY
jgi:hypothetical protein